MLLSEDCPRHQVNRSSLSVVAKRSDYIYIYIYIFISDRVASGRRFWPGRVARVARVFSAKIRLDDPQPRTSWRRDHFLVDNYAYNLPPNISRKSFSANTFWANLHSGSLIKSEFDKKRVFGNEIPLYFSNRKTISILYQAENETAPAPPKAGFSCRTLILKNKILPHLL